MADESGVEIFVQLLDEGTEVWRPIRARCVGGSHYRILSVNEDPEDERWEFITGDVVRCVPTTFHGGTHGLIAVEHVAGPGEES